MFSISFTGEPLAKVDADEEGSVGLLMLGGYEERFVAHLHIWSEREYVVHWADALKRVLDGKPAALITDMQTPAFSSHLIWWPTWRIESEIVLHNQLFFFEKHRIQGRYFDPQYLYGFIGERLLRNEDGIPLSEWTVPVSDVEAFLAGDSPLTR